MFKASGPAGAHHQDRGEADVRCIYIKHGKIKPHRSRRIVKKLLQRAVPHPDWQHIDALIADGKRIITAREIRTHGLRWPAFAQPSNRV